MTSSPTTDVEANTTLTSVDPEYYSVDGPRSAPDVRILGSRCADTAATFWPRRLRSPITGGELADIELASTGTVWSWTYVHFPWMGECAPSSTIGYGVCLVDLDDDGPRVTGLFLGDEGTLAVGDRVHASALPVRFEETHAPSVLAFERVSK